MRTFFVVWFGQQISLIGSGLTGFAMGVWVYQRTESVTLFSLISVSAILPDILISPLAGVLTDRWNRKWVMILSDTGSGFCTLAMVLLLLTYGTLEIWEICLFNAISSAFRAFQHPAFTATVTLIVPKQHLGRASGMTHAGYSVAQLISPVVAGVLMGMIQIRGVILIDFITFIFALVTLIIVRIPDAPVVPDEDSGKGSMLREAVYGWKYVIARPGLFGLMIFFAVTSFFEETVIVLVTPLALSFSSPAVLGTVLSIGGAGMLAGSLLMSIWGSPKRLILGIFSLSLLGGISIMTVGFHRYIPLMAVSAFLYLFTIPLINGYSQVILQKKVAPGVQGRVFAMEGMISTSCFPLSYLVAGPMADYVFEPLMAADGPLAGTVGQILGTGPGWGIALMFIIMGSLSMLATVIAWGYPRLRRVEEELPDQIPE